MLCIRHVAICIWHVVHEPCALGIKGICACCRLLALGVQAMFPASRSAGKTASLACPQRSQHGTGLALCSQRSQHGTGLAVLHTGVLVHEPCALGIKGVISTTTTTTTTTTTITTATTEATKWEIATSRLPAK